MHHADSTPCVDTMRPSPAACLALVLTLIAISSCALGKERGAASSPTLASGPSKWVNIDVSSSGRTIRVRAGQDFQAALHRAEPGDTIELEAGATYRGPFILPRKRATRNGQGQWITIRPSKGSIPLPPPGVRVSPADAPAMARLETAIGAVVTTAPGAHHYRFIGIEFSAADTPKDAKNPAVLNGLVWLRAQGAHHLPHHFIFERCYLHGDPKLGTRRAIIMNSAVTAVVDSYLSDFKFVGEDSQAIIGWSGPGPYRIENNYLEGAGENIMFGGGDPYIHLLVPSDIEIRRNHFAKPTAWQAQRHWTVKNLFELKNARRVLIDGNLFEYNWPHSQNGFAILFTVRNQDDSAPWSVVEDVIFSNNIIRHVANGINILGHDDNHHSQQTRRIHIRNNLFQDLGGSWGPGNLFQLLDGVESVVIEHNTALNTGTILFAEGRPHQGFRFRNNIVIHNQRGIVGTDSGVGRPVLKRYFPESVIRDNMIVGGSVGYYRKGNSFPASMKSVGFIDPDGGDYRLSPASDNGFGVGVGVDFSELCAALSATERPFFCTDGKSTAMTR